MNDRESWLQRLTERADLTTEPLPGIPIAELAGDRRLLVENHSGVTEYSPMKIGIRVRYGSLQICGCGLTLTRMTKEHLLVKGRIDSIHLIRR